jgi:hypothetical protein
MSAGGNLGLFCDSSDFLNLPSSGHRPRTPLHINLIKFDLGDAGDSEYFLKLSDRSYYIDYRFCSILNGISKLEIWDILTDGMYSQRYLCWDDQSHFRAWRLVGILV